MKQYKCLDFKCLPTGIFQYSKYNSFITLCISIFSIYNIYHICLNVNLLIFSSTYNVKMEPLIVVVLNYFTFPYALHYFVVYSNIYFCSCIIWNSCRYVIFFVSHFSTLLLLTIVFIL